MSKSSLNFLFGIIVAALAFTAIASVYVNSKQPEMTERASTDVQLPEKHPPLDYEGRIAALEQLIARDPKNADYTAQMANLYYDLGQYDKAADYYQRSLSVRPQDPNVETDLATCYHYLGNDDKALEILDNVLRYSPHFTQAKFNKGIVLIEGKKDVKGGISVWEDLLRSDPQYEQRAGLEQRIQQLKASLR